MIKFKTTVSTLVLVFLLSPCFAKKKDNIQEEIQQTMLKATRFMVEDVSYNGGYLWSYLPDFSRQWGEMEAYKTMIWLQHPGTISMGHLFLDAFHATDNEYYYKAAEKAAYAIIWGQSDVGGWNYMIDFAGDRSLKHWYSTIGKNGWRLEEFQHYYGNCTFDDDTSSDAARFLLRMYLEKFDPKFKPALDKAIDFVLKSQFEHGGWPQRYPLNYEYSKNGRPDYSSYSTFNDDVIWENIHFLIQCYLSLGEERFLDPIRRGMNFYIISQQGNGAWGQQCDLELNPAGARSYEPKALLPDATFENAMLLLEYYKMTGEDKYISHVPDAIKWLENTKLPDGLTQGGKYTHPRFIDPQTNKPIYVHRKGSNVKYGYYYVDNNDEKLLAHSGGKRHLSIERLKEKYNTLKSMLPEEVTKDSPLKPNMFTKDTTPQKFYDLNRNSYDQKPDESKVIEVMNSLNEQNCWLSKRARTSNPYIGDGQKQELTDKYASTNVGDETDTSPYWDTTGQEYISTGLYLKNMELLINYLEQKKK